jgi:hypothetical protein
MATVLQLIDASMTRRQADARWMETFVAPGVHTVQFCFSLERKRVFFSGGDFTYIDPYSWSSLWMQHWRGWVRIKPECGKLVMFQNRLEPSIVHSITPLWSTSAGLSFEHAGRYTLNIWFTDLGDADAEEHFRTFAVDRFKSDYRGFGAWPQHRCLSGHSSWRKALKSQGGGKAKKSLNPLDTEAATDSMNSEQDLYPDQVARSEDPRRERKNVPDIFPWPVDFVFEEEPSAAPEAPVTKAAYQAGITALHHDGSKAKLRVNVPGGRRLRPAEVFKEAVQYVEKHPKRALVILKRLAHELGIAKSAVQTIHSAEPFLRGVALQANLAAVRERLRADKVIGADGTDRAGGIALLLLNTALSEANPLMEL